MYWVRGCEFAFTSVLGYQQRFHAEAEADADAEAFRRVVAQACIGNAIACKCYKCAMVLPTHADMH